MQFCGTCTVAADTRQILAKDCKVDTERQARQLNTFSSAEQSHKLILYHRSAKTAENAKKEAVCSDIRTPKPMVDSEGNSTRNSPTHRERKAETLDTWKRKIRTCDLSIWIVLWLVRYRRGDQKCLYQLSLA